jgi:hypothetical protein
MSALAPGADIGGQTAPEFFAMRFCLRGCASAGLGIFQFQRRPPFLPDEVSYMRKWLPQRGGRFGAWTAAG